MEIITTVNLGDWLGRALGAEFVWYIKRLSGNDTLANDAHQAGPYIPRDFLREVLPGLNRPDAANPDVRLRVSIDSHADYRHVRAVWYNNALRGGTRNEARITGWGGRNSPLLDPENTGALTVFSFRIARVESLRDCHVWVCRDVEEEQLIQAEIGPVDPGESWRWSASSGAVPTLFGRPVLDVCKLTREELPEAWLEQFPTGAEVVAKVLALRPKGNQNVDERLLNRRRCEFELFRSLEEAIELPVIERGFKGVDEFIARAQRILQRRKARSGRSLELHVRAVLEEEGLNEGRAFSYQPESEDGKQPDFLFPSEEAYKDPQYPSNNLRMLAVKTTCKDRWRQILNEADRVESKHLLTLQEGVSRKQFDEMSKARIQLVVPEKHIVKFPVDVRPHLLTFRSFLAEVGSIV